MHSECLSVFFHIVTLCLCVWVHSRLSRAAEQKVSTGRSCCGWTLGFAVKKIRTNPKKIQGHFLTSASAYKAVSGNVITRILYLNIYKTTCLYIFFKKGVKCLLEMEHDRSIFWLIQFVCPACFRTMYLYTFGEKGIEDVHTG